jgi:hypothetical protein
MRRNAMHFPEISRHDDQVLVDAVARRDDAREGYKRLSGLAAAAVGTPAHVQGSDLRDAAHARLVACDAWVGWIRDGV